MAVVLVLDAGGDDRDGRVVLVARDRPAVVELLGHGHQVGVGLLEDRIQADHVAEGTGDEDVQPQALVGEGVADGCDIGRVGGAFKLKVVEHGRVGRLEIDAGHGDVAVLVQEGRKAFVVQSLERDGEDGMVRIAFHAEARAGDQVDDPPGGQELGDFVVGVGIDDVRRPGEVTGPDVGRGQAELDTVGLHGGGVARLGDGTVDTLGPRGTDQVEVVALVPVAGEVHAVVEEAQFQADVQLVLLLVGERRVRGAGQVQVGFAVIGEIAPGRVGPEDGQGVGDRSPFRGQGIGSLDGGVREIRLETAHPGFVDDVPLAGNVPGRQPAGGPALAELVGALVADRAVDVVLALIGIGARREESRAAVVGMGHGVIVGTVLLALLEDAVVVVRFLTQVVLHAPAAEPRGFTVDAVDLHTRVRVDGMGAEGLVVGGRQSGVPAEHLVVRPFEDTAVREDDLRDGVRIVLVGVQVRVVVPDGGRLLGPVGLRLVGVVLDVVQAGRGAVLRRGEGGEFQLLEHLPLHLALEPDVRHVDVQVVVLQFMHDVERSVVAGVELVRIQRAGGVQRVGVRVDVEVTLHLAVHGVDLGAQGSRRALFAVRGVADDVERDVLEQFLRRVHVGGETLDGALQRPARVVHDGHGGVVVARVRAAAQGDGVVVLDVVGEQPVEPVRVAVLGGAEIGGLGGGRVLQAELPGRLVELGDQLVHLSVDTALRSVGRPRVLQVTLLLQFLVDTHLVLRIHDVEVRVAGLQADGVFTRVVHAAVARTALLGGHDDNARHGARAVDGGRGTVLEEVETLDIVGVQAGDRRGDQGVRVTGGEGLGVHFHHVLHDDAVHHPQRGGRAVDGGGAADADLRGRTERTGYVLDRDARHTAFQGTGDVGDTGDVGGRGVHLGGGAGEHAPVHGGHTRDDGLFEDLGIRLQGDADIVPHRNFLFLEAHERDHEVLRALRYLVQDKVTVQVCHGSHLAGAFDIHVRAGDRLSVIGGDDRTPDRQCLREGSRHSQEDGTCTEQIL